MAAEEKIVSGKSKYEIAYGLSRDLLYSSDGPADNATRKQRLEHFIAARRAVYDLEPCDVEHAIDALEES